MPTRELPSGTILADLVGKRHIGESLLAILSKGYDDLDADVRKAFESRFWYSADHDTLARQWETDFIASLGVEDINSVKHGSVQVDNQIAKYYAEEVSEVLAKKGSAITFENIDELTNIPQYLLVGEKTLIGSNKRFQLLSILMENVAASEIFFIPPADKPKYDKILQYSAAFLLWSRKVGGDEGTVNFLLNKYKRLSRQSSQ